MASVLKTGRAGGEEWSQQDITSPFYFSHFFLFGTVLVITEGMGLLLHPQEKLRPKEGIFRQFRANMALKGNMHIEK